MEQEQFKAEVLPLRNKLFSIARNMLGGEQEAEDITQEVLIKLWNARATLNRYNSIEAFAVTITKNTCIDHLRIRGRTEDVAEYELQGQAGSDNPHLQLELKDTNKILEYIIGQLPHLQQAIIKMKDIEEMEVDEIATITGTRPDSIRVNLSRARRKVKEEYLKWIK